MNRIGTLGAQRGNRKKNRTGARQMRDPVYKDG